MGLTSRRSLHWPTAVLAVLAVPILLLSAWAFIVYGGTLERLEQEEGRQAEALLKTFDARFEAQLDEPGEEAVALELDSQGRVKSPFLTAPAPISATPSSTTPDPQPNSQPGIPSVRGARSVAEQQALKLELRASHSESLLWFQQAARPLSPAGTLAYARCLAATGEAEAAMKVLEPSPATEPIVWLDSLPFEVLKLLLRARIARDLGDPQIATKGLIDVAKQEIACTARALPAVIAELRQSSPQPENQATRDRLDSLLAAARLAREDPIQTVSGRRSDGSFATVRAGDILVRGPHLVRRLRQDAEAYAETKTPDYTFVRTGDRALAALDSLSLGERIFARPIDTLGSTRLRSLASGLLIFALLALALGNLLLFRLARREMALSHMRANFIDLVSHELRTPLTALSMKTEMLAHQEVPEAKIQSYQRDLYSDVQRLTELVNRILDFARLERGKIPLQRQSTSARCLIAEALRMGRAALSLGGQELVIDVGRDLPTIEVDSEVLARALRNLLENATRYAPKASTITVRAIHADAFLEISVEDQGPGLGSTAPGELFVAFRRGPEHRTSPGSGLGLAIVRQAIEAHGGSVTAAERESGGARFTLRIPVMEVA